MRSLAAAGCLLALVAARPAFAQPAVTDSAGDASYTGAEPPRDYEPSDDEREARSAWNPKTVFPGNYWALPVTASVSFSPCLDCRALFAVSPPILSRPGSVSVWAGYAFQPLERASSPFLAPGVEWTFFEKDAEEKSHWRRTLTPELRAGWNFTGLSVWGAGGVILPGEDRNRAGWHAGAGASSFAMIVVSLCSEALIPSTVELGYDWLPPDPIDGRSRDRTILKLGWGF